MVDNNSDYGVAARILHWLFLALVIVMLTLGFVLKQAPASEHKDILIILHSSLGLILLAIVIISLTSKACISVPWRKKQMSKQAKAAMILSQWIIYIFISLQAITGMLRLLLSGENIQFFSFFTIDYLQKRPTFLAKTAAWFHDYDAYLLAVLVILSMGFTIFCYLNERVIE